MKVESVKSCHAHLKKNVTIKIRFESNLKEIKYLKIGLKKFLWLGAPS